MLNVELPGHIHGVNFLSDSVGYVTGGDTWFSGFVGTTGDGGNSWIYDSISAKMMMCLDVEDNRGIISGFEGRVYNLNNEEWLFQNINRNDFIRDVEIIDDTSTLLVGGLAYRRGRIIKITSTGNVRSVWTEDEDNPELSAIAQLDENTFLAVGYGRILRSIDKGETWSSLEQDGDFFKDVIFTDALTGYIIGYDGLILKSTDAGQSWKKVRGGGNLDSGDRLNAITITPSGHLWVCGKSGLVLISEDEGENWYQKKIDTDDDLNVVSYHNDNIYIGGQDGFFAQVKL